MWCASFLFTAHDGACSRGNELLADSVQAMLNSSFQRHSLKRTHVESKGSFRHSVARSSLGVGLSLCTNQTPPHCCNCLLTAPLQDYNSNFVLIALEAPTWRRKYLIQQNTLKAEYAPFSLVGAVTKDQTLADLTRPGMMEKICSMAHQNLITSYSRR